MSEETVNSNPITQCMHFMSQVQHRHEIDFVVDLQAVYKLHEP